MKNNLQKFTAATTLNSFGDGLLFVGISWYLYYNSKSISFTGLYFVTQSLIGIFISGLAASYISKKDKRLACTISCTAKSLLGVAIVLIANYFPGYFYLFIIVGGISAICDRFFWPASSVLVKISFNKDLLRVNSIAGIGTQSGYIAGVTLGGTIIATLGSGFIFSVYSLALMAAALFFKILDTSDMVGVASDVTRSELSSRENSSLLKNVLWANNGVTPASVLQTALYSILNTVNILLAPFCVSVLATNAAGYGVIDAAWGIGAVLGATTSMVTSRREVNLEKVSMLLMIMSVLLVFFAFSKTVYLATAVYFFIGASFLIARVSLDSYLQINTPVEYLAKLRGLLSTLNSCLSLAIYLAAYYIIKNIGVKEVYFMCSAFILTLVFVSYGLNTYIKRSIFRRNKSVFIDQTY